jgi:hypothetical protein
LTPGGSSIHLHTNSTQNTEDGTHITITIKNNYKGQNWEVIWEVRAVPRLCELYPGIFLTTEKTARKNLSKGSRKVLRYSGGSCQISRWQFKNI